MHAHDALIWSPDVIAHHGILKQKWGVRHGPPYPLDESDKSQAQKKAAAADKKEESESSSGKSSSSSSSSSKKSVKEMTDEELIRGINRASLEKRYTELTKEPEAQKKTSLGGQILKEVGTDITKNTLKNLGGQTATLVLGTGINEVLKKFGGEDFTINPKKGQKDK